MNCQRHLIIRKGNKALPFPTPFIPCVANLFPFLAQRFAWGEERVVFPDPQTHEVRSLPVAWTSLAPPDPFLVGARGKTARRFQDVQRLVQWLRARHVPGGEDC